MGRSRALKHDYISHDNVKLSYHRSKDRTRLRHLNLVGFVTSRLEEDLLVSWVLRVTDVENNCCFHSKRSGGKFIPPKLVGVFEYVGLHSHKISPVKKFLWQRKSPQLRRLVLRVKTDLF